MSGFRISSAVFALFLLSLPLAAQAEEHKPDDRVIFDISAEDWVTTKTARVTVNVAASVSGATAGSARSAIAKALEELVETDWRLISFNRGQDQTGMERWNAVYEARLPENMLSGLGENAKKLSKPGMQISIANIDFSPTLEEMQTAMAEMRKRIYKTAGEQLATLNSSLPGRNYRIAMINFVPRAMEPAGAIAGRRMKAEAMMAMSAEFDGGGEAPAPALAPMERSEKIVMTARIVFAAAPEAQEIHLKDQ